MKTVKKGKKETEGSNTESNGRSRKLRRFLKKEMLERRQKNIKRLTIDID